MTGINEIHTIDKRRKCFNKDHPDSCFYSGGFKHCDCYQGGERCHCCGADPGKTYHGESTPEIELVDRNEYR